MPIILKGATSGQVTLDTPAIAGTNNLELPAATGTIQLLKLETAQATTSGTFKDFTGIPSWAKKITVMLNSVSTNGTSLVQVQIGTSSGIETTGYLSGNSASNFLSSGFMTGANNTATDWRIGAMTITLLGSNLWIMSGSIGASASGAVSGQSYAMMGNKTLSGTLDRVRITTVNGTDTFDNGSVNILIEGN
jgi:hypothetical protein